MDSKKFSQNLPMDKPAYKFDEWDLKTKYQVAFADAVEQRTTMMKFLLDNYGIEAVEKFFLHDNPQWAEKLKVGLIKKLIAKILAKLLPHQIMRRLSEIIVTEAQYLVGLEHVTISEITDDYELIDIQDCPVLKQFKRTLKSLKFSNLEERYICTFACVPLIQQMAAVGYCGVQPEYFEKGCQLRVSLKAKSAEELEQTECDTSVPLKNGVLK